MEEKNTSVKRGVFISPEVQPNREPLTNPVQPDEGQQVQPSRPDTEINPAKTGNDTEVELDKEKIKTYPPERH